MLGHRVLADRYRLGRCVGRGELAAVYRACDLSTSGPVALKLSLPERRAIERTLREARLLERLSHPGVVQHLAHGETPDGEVWLAMEWIEGEDLAARHRRQPLDIQAALGLAQQLARTLAALHERAIVHRDITPGNLMVFGTSPAVKIVDFNVATQRGTLAEDPGATTLVGTPPYMAPEQALGRREVGPEADVYALGAVLFELLTGTPLFDAASRMALLGRIVLEPVPRLSRLRPELPHVLDVLLARILAKEPADRPAASELAAELSNIHLDGAVSSLPSARGSAPEATLDSPPDGERRVLVVLLAGLAQELPVPAALVDSLTSAAGPAALCRQLSDGTFLAAFGGVHTRGDEIVSAARLALAARLAHPMLRIAIATGLAEHDHESGPTGEALERSAAHLAAGTRGEIVLDSASATLLGGRFSVTWDEVGRRALLSDELDEAHAPPRVVGQRSPFVGRGRELGLALGIYREAVEERAPRVVHVYGAPGAGKSRLRAELLSELARGAEPPVVIYCRGDGATADVAYAALGRALRRVAGVDEVEGRGTRRLVATERLAAPLDGSEHVRVVPFLLELAGVHIPEAEAPLLRSARRDPMVMRERVRSALVEWASAAARIRPLAFIVEDVQDVDADSLRLIESMVRQVEDAPLFVLLLGRATGEGTLPHGLVSEAVGVSLSALPRRAAERLVRALLPQSADPAVREIVERSGGNPLFVEELVRVLAEGRSASLPPTVQAVLQARLDGLPREARRVARAASVFGAAFWEGGVAHLVPDANLAEALSLLQRAEFVVPRSTSRLAGQREWTFPMPLMREVAYEMLGPQERQRLHRLAAHWLETATPGDDAVVAPHLDRAGAGDQAARRYVSAAVRALGAGALDAAVHSSTRALELHVGGHERPRALLTRCEAKLRLAQYDAAAADGLAAAAATTATPAERILGYGFAGRGRRLEGRAQEALLLFQAGLDVDAESDAASHAQLKMRIWRCAALADAGRPEEARGEISTLRRQCSAHPDPLLRFSMQFVAAHVAYVAGEIDVVLAAAGGALDEAEQLGDSLRMAQALDLLARAQCAAGVEGLALEHAVRAARKARLARAAGVEVSARTSMAQALAVGGSLDEAIAELESALDLAERVQVPSLHASVLGHLALLYLERGRAGDSDRGLTHARRAQAVVPENATTSALVSLALGRVLLVRGDPAEAEALVRVHASRAHPYELRTRLTHFEALTALGRRAEAASVLDAAHARLQELAASLTRLGLEEPFRALPDQVRIARLIRGGPRTELEA